MLARKKQAENAAVDETAELLPIAETGAVAVHPIAAPGEDDIRKPQRRGESALRKDRVSLASFFGSHHLLPPEFWLLAPLILLAAICSGLASGSPPPLWPALVLSLAALCAGLSYPMALFERRRERRRALQQGLLFAGVLAPLALAGAGFAAWARLGALDWIYAVSALVLISTVAATSLRHRLFAIFAGTFVLWAAVAAVLWSLPGFVALAVVAGIFRLMHRRQEVIDGQIALDIQAAERIRDRAEDILCEYEETGQGWFWETDRRGRINYVSSTAAKVVGTSARELIGQHLTELFDLNDRSADGERTLAFHLSSRSAFHELNVRAAVTGQVRWWSVSGRPNYDEFGNFVGFRGSGTDLTERRKSQETASRLALFDSLTELANRLQMSQALERQLAKPHVGQRSCAVFLLDLDRFKQVNDTLGHPAGDALLKQVAERLTTAIGPMGQVGRLGGDEFEVIVNGAPGRERLGELAHNIIHQLSQPYSIEGHRVTIGASIGIALSPEDGTTSEALIRNADLALYAAKDGGRGRYHFYAEDLHAQAQERRQLEQDLRDAMATGGLRLAYQPVVDTMSEKISGFEALLRWNHPTKGPLSPDKFVPIAEDAGLIVAIGEWAIRTACSDLAQWPEEVRVAVNVSPLQFASPQLPSTITHAIAQAGIDPARLELEITESVFLNDDEGTDAMFAALKKIGVRLALDDFGTGYSSLGYLKKAPFDKIKIDQSFVRGATEPGSRNGAIIASITSLAQALGMDTTAEGVETMDELDLVRMYGCSHVQGFIYERPLTAEDATARIKTGLAAVALGPRSARVARQTMLRKIVLDHNGQLYNGTIRNVSQSGALIEGLWNVPSGTKFAIALSESVVVEATARWCNEDRMGVEFVEPLKRASNGSFVAMQGSASPQIGEKVPKSQQKT